MAFEKYILPSKGDPKMPVHLFNAIISEYIAGEKTAVECKEVIETYLNISLSSDEQDDLTALITAINGGSGVEKRAIADDLYRVLVLAEHGIWYTDKAALKSRLSWI